MTHSAADTLAAFLTYPLPTEQIALQPAAEREAARLLVVDRANNALHDTIIAQLPEWLQSGDLLVRNTTRVEKLLTYLRKPTGGRVELIWVRELAADRWRVFGETSKLRPEMSLTGEGSLRATCLSIEGRYAELSVESPASMSAWFAAHGHVPLPPYIRKHRRKSGVQIPEVLDIDRYQTAYAGTGQSLAAPTAGLHFSETLLQGIKQAGIDVADVDLTVGPGTFTEVTASDIDDVRVAAETAEIPAPTVARLKEVRSRGARIIPIGTTSLRTLEGLMGTETEGGLRGDVDITIKPGYPLQWSDGLLTNFHLPNTTLRLLVAAVAGADQALQAYEHAVAAGYRFFSYGDAMLIV